MTVTVDSTFLAKPTGSAKLKDGDDAITEYKTAWYERAIFEHIGKTTETQSRHGEHRKGSAMGYYQATAPTTKPDGVTALDTNDTGRYWYDTTNAVLKVYKGTVLGWVSAIFYPIRLSVYGGLYVGSGVVPDILIPYDITITKVVAKLGTAPTGTNDVRFDIKNLGANSIFTAGYAELGDTSVTTFDSTDFNATYTPLSAGDYLTVDITQIGSTITGSDLSLLVIGAI